MKDLSGPTAHGMDNLLYSADADFSCFADLALVSPVDYYKEGQGSLMQVGAAPAWVLRQRGRCASVGAAPAWVWSGGLAAAVCLPVGWLAGWLAGWLGEWLAVLNQWAPVHLLCLLQCVLTPAAPYMAKSNEEIAAETDRQVGAAPGRAAR